MGLFDSIGNMINKIVSPVVGTLGAGIGQATGSTGLGDASAESIAAQERMHEQDLELEREKLALVKTSGQTGISALSPIASKPTSETAKQTSPLPLALAGLAVGYFVFKKGRKK